MPPEHRGAGPCPLQGWSQGSLVGKGLKEKQGRTPSTQGWGRAKRFRFPEPLKTATDKLRALPPPQAHPHLTIAPFWDSHSGDARLQCSLPGPVVILRTGADDPQGPN